MNEFFEKIKNALSLGQSTHSNTKNESCGGMFEEAQKVDPLETFVRKVCTEVLPDSEAWVSRVALSDSPTWEEAKNNWPNNELVELAIYCFTQTREHWSRRTGWSYRECSVLETITSQLLRKKLQYSEGALAELFSLVNDVSYGHPLAALAGASERLLCGEAAAGILKTEIEACLKKFDEKNEKYSLTQTERRLKTRLENLIAPRDPNVDVPLPQGAWLTSAFEDLSTNTEKQQTAWNKLFVHALTSTGKSKPTMAWLKEAERLIKLIGRPRFTTQVTAWFNTLKPEPEGSVFDPETRTHVTNHDQTLDIAKGLMWMTATLRDNQLTLALGRATETCYKKIPHYGARSKRLGNAGIVALSLMEGDQIAIAELVRLKTQVKYPTIKTDIQKKLQSVANKLGIHVADLEEHSLPSFGLDIDGMARFALSDVTATITLTDAASLIWTNANGKPVKSVPASVKRDHPETLKQLKQSVRDINSALKTQISRLEASWIEGRTWTIDEWRKRFVEHPLRRQFSRNLIWSLSSGDRVEHGMLDGDELFMLNDQRISRTDDGSVALWHPLDSDPETVLAWRRKIIEREITQPIKQAHREVYVLTDAERETDTYSNRFAAHILRQHQFRALCQTRDWKYDLMGMWDSWNVPTRSIPSRGVCVEYHVELVDNDQHTESYVPFYLATDQVRFIDSNGDRMRLESIQPVLFSELFRDVDLFVAVASVANDPEWTDGGPDGRHSEYWTSYAFGDLSETAQTRKELLEDLVPKLAISEKLAVSDKFLEVKGTRNDYRIHLGSSNIQIMPSKQYLCIVRGFGKKNETKIHLPFAGDNMLSIILSKAFLLAADDKITDQTILSQLSRN